MLVILARFHASRAVHTAPAHPHIDPVGLSSGRPQAASKLTIAVQQVPTVFAAGWPAPRQQSPGSTLRSARHLASRCLRREQPHGCRRCHSGVRASAACCGTCAVPTPAATRARSQPGPAQCRASCEAHHDAEPRLSIWLATLVVLTATSHVRGRASGSMVHYTVVFMQASAGGADAQ